MKYQLTRMRRLAAGIKRRFSAPPEPAPSADGVPETHDFVCNVCGHANRAVPLAEVRSRECQSCAHCRSSLRMRSVMHALGRELFDAKLSVPEFPVAKDIRGLGMSDWPGYADRLVEKFSYVNTYYHTEPRLDITDVPDSAAGTQRFLISSDVFEHIPGFALDAAFRNSRKLLTPNGVFLFTVPFVKTGETQEHFPRLHDFRIIETRGKRFLYNRTIEGEEEIFDDLCFHGGEGMTLEMRMFSEPDLKRRLKAAGFSSVRVYTDQVPEYGIIWPMDWAVPIAARA